MKKMDDERGRKKRRADVEDDEIYEGGS